MERADFVGVHKAVAMGLDLSFSPLPSHITLLHLASSLGNTYVVPCVHSVCFDKISTKLCVQCDGGIPHPGTT